jgi:hypothetical protein
VFSTQYSRNRIPGNRLLPKLKMSDPKLTITLSKDDYDDLTNGKYYVHFTRKVIDVDNKPLGVWAYTALAGSKVVSGKSGDTRERIEN